MSALAKKTDSSFTAGSDTNADYAEAELVGDIVKAPADRQAFIALAEFLEAQGNEKHAAIVYRGNLPLDIRRKYDLEAIRSARTDKMQQCHRISFYPPEIYPLHPPINNDHRRHIAFDAEKITTLPEFVDVLEQGTLVYDNKNCLYATDTGIRHAEHSTANSYLLANRLTDTQHSIELAGRSLLLAGRNSNNFYHWHFDRLPALGLLEAAGIGIADVDHILLNPSEGRFQLETLMALGVTEEQIIYLPHQTTTVHCEQLLLVRAHNQLGMAQSRRHIDWLRARFLPVANSVNDKLIQRENCKIAIHRSKRGFANAETIYQQLEKQGYRIVKPEDYSYTEQVRLFNQATHIIAPHGAALSLLAYCRPGTQVHEFYGEHVHACFWTLSCVLSLEYHNYNCSRESDHQAVYTNKGLGSRINSDIELDTGFLDTLAI